MNKLHGIEVSLLAVATFCAAPAAAQESTVPPTASATEGTTEDTGLGEIIVTAQRRSENIQRAAVAITAVTGETLQNRGISQTEDLANLSASMQVNTSAGPYSTFSIRSVSSLSGNAFADPAVAVNFNGVYLATPTVIHGLYYDLERVEILKGPQGTLYGRNATGGAINILAKRPTFETGFGFNADIGNYDRRNFGAMVNIPMSDTIAFRLAGQAVSRDGYMSDGSNDDKGGALRGSLLFKPSSDVSLLITGDFAHQGGKGPGATVRKRCSLLGQTGGACFVADPYTAVPDLPAQYTSVGQAPQTRNGYIDGDYYGLGVNLDVTTGLGLVSFIGGWRKSNNGYLGTGTSWQISERQHPEQWSTELRLASQGNGPLQYVIGGYYLDTKNKALARGENGSRRSFSEQHTDVSGYTAAAFGQLTYSLTDALRATGGVRYTYEKKSSNSLRYNITNLPGPDPVFPANPGPVTASVIGSKSWDEVNWKAGLEFDAGPRSLLYANVSTGFKAGGFFYGPANAQIYEPEHVTSYVLGSKNRFLDNRLQINGEAFYLDYRNQQVSFVKLVGASAVLVTENAGKSTAKGAELEVEFLATPQTRLSSQVQYLKAEFDRFSYSTIAPPGSTTKCIVGAAVAGAFPVDCSGNDAVRSPRWTIQGGIEQGFPVGAGRIVAEAFARYQSGFEGDVAYQVETRTYGTTRVDLGLGYEAPDDAFKIKAYVENLTDEVTIANVTVNTSYASNNIVGANLLAPRTYGVRLSMKY